MDFFVSEQGLVKQHLKLVTVKTKVSTTTSSKTSLSNYFFFFLCAFCMQGDSYGLHLEEGLKCTLRFWRMNYIMRLRFRFTQLTVFIPDDTGEEIGQLQAEEDVVMNTGETDGETADIHTHRNSIVVIEINDDDEIDGHDEDRHIWHYKDPNGDTQGPFPSKYLRVWKAKGFVDANFKAWRGGHDVSEAICLNDLLR